jgi:hypothetical protein
VRFIVRGRCQFLRTGNHKSDDGGESWHPMAGGIQGLIVHPLVADPVHPGVVYAGTLGGSMRKTVDGGNTWPVVFTGKDEILSLQWKQVRPLQNELHLPGGKTKTKKPRQIPISPELRKVLDRRQHGKTGGPNPQTFTFGRDHYVFGNEAGGRIKNVKTAWETAVLKAHGVKPERTRGKLSATCRAKLAEIDLNFHDLRHEAGSRKLEVGWAPTRSVGVARSHEARNDGEVSERDDAIPARTQRARAVDAREALTLSRRVTPVNASAAMSIWNTARPPTPEARGLH